MSRTVKRDEFLYLSPVLIKTLLIGLIRLAGHETLNNTCVRSPARRAEIKEHQPSNKCHSRLKLKQLVNFDIFNRCFGTPTVSKFSHAEETHSADVFSSMGYAGHLKKKVEETPRTENNVYIALVRFQMQTIKKYKIS